MRARASLVAGMCALVALTGLGALASCKDKERGSATPAASATPPPATVPAGSAAASTTPARPSPPTPAPGPIGEPLSIDDAAKVLPQIDGKEILPLKQTSDNRQVHGTWCIDGDGADEVARRIGRAMADAGYSNLGIRGDAKKAGVQGDRDAFRMSMIVSASSAVTCPAPKHYFASATIFRK